MNTPLRTLAVSAASLALVAAVAPQASAAQLALATQYACDTPLGGGPTTVGVATTLPKKAVKNQRVAGDTANVVIVLPEQVVDALRSYNVTSVSGTVSGAALTVGSTSVKLRALKIAKTAVPSSGQMTLNAAGTRVGFSIARTGTYTVTIPGSFDADLTGTTASGQTGELPASCALEDGSPSKLGALKVTR